MKRRTHHPGRVQCESGPSRTHHQEGGTQWEPRPLRRRTRRTQQWGVKTQAGEGRPSKKGYNGKTVDKADKVDTPSKKGYNGSQDPPKTRSHHCESRLSEGRHTNQKETKGVKTPGQRRASGRQTHTPRSGKTGYQGSQDPQEGTRTIQGYRSESRRGKIGVNTFEKADC